jgi:hypothetical protein
MAKLMKPDGSTEDVKPQYPAGFLPSELKRFLGADEFLFIPLNSEVMMIVARENAGLPKNEPATVVARKSLSDRSYEILGPALLANTDDLTLWLEQPPEG